MRRGMSKIIASPIDGLAHPEVTCRLPSDSCGREDGMRLTVTVMLSVNLLLVGCANKHLIQERTDGFIGQPLSAVTSKLGAPTGEHEIEGAKVFVWSSGGEAAPGKCTIRAVVRGDIIGSFDWEGTEGQCASYALMLEGPDCRRGKMDARLWVPSCP
jgi:hypothetical protein